MNHIQDSSMVEFLISYQQPAYRLAMSYLHDREEALDAVQSAVCRALERQDSLRDMGAVRPWFTRILVNVCLDTLRRRGKVVFVPPEALDTASYEDPLPADGTLYDRVNALPPEVATVVKLRFYEEMSLRDISQVTGWNINTVKSRLYGGLKKLRLSVEGEELS